MSRRRQALRFQAVLRRLHGAGLRGILHEVLELPSALSRPVAKLADVLHLPPALLWAALAALLGSAVLAVSWILTAFILVLTRGPEGGGEPGIRKQRRRSGGFMHRSDLNNDAISADESASGVDGSAEDSDGDRRGSLATHRPNNKKNDDVNAAQQTALAPSGQVAGATSSPPWAPPAHLKGVPYSAPAGWRPSARHHLRHPLLDEQDEVKVRRAVSYYTSVIPATPFEAVRQVEEVFGLGLDAEGYGRLLGGDGVVAASACAEGDDDGTAALGRVALQAHMARYVYGMYDNTVGGGRGGAGGASTTESATDGRNTQGLRSAGELPPPTPSPPPPTPPTPPPAADAVLSAVDAYLQPEVLAALARRLRLDLLLLLSPHHQQRQHQQQQQQQELRKKQHVPPTAAAVAAAAIAGGRRSAAARRAVPAAAASSSAAPTLGPAAAAAALLRLVWALHLADPGRAWLVACVLARLASDLRLVP